MKLELDNYADLMSTFYKARLSLTNASPTLTLDAQVWANENAPGYASMGSAFWFKHEEEAVMFTLRFG